VSRRIVDGKTARYPRPPDRAGTSDGQGATGEMPEMDEKARMEIRFYEIIA